MRQQLVPMLLLAAALSHVLSAPLASAHTLSRQTNDNTFRNIYDTRNMYTTILCKETLGAIYGDASLKPCSYYRQRGYQGSDNRRSYEGTLNKDDTYNGEGFRKEQWHNYPRQLDRLQHSPYDRNKEPYVKRIFEPDDTDSDESPANSLSDYLTTNEYLLANDAPQNVYDSIVASTSPLLILKIRLACLNDGRANRTLADAAKDMIAQIDAHNLKREIDNEAFIRDEPNVEVLPVKREDSLNEQDVEIWAGEASSPERVPVQKRLFSLWSRLQSLSHKGHELHHRRHMHFLGLPDQMGGEATLTAETRAALMRPPGSPLRWG